MQKLNIIPKRKESQRNDIVTVLEFWGVLFLCLIFATLLS